MKHKEIFAPVFLTLVALVGAYIVSHNKSTLVRQSDNLSQVTLFDPKERGLSVTKIPEKYNEIFDQLQLGEYDISLAGDPGETVFAVVSFPGVETNITLADAFLKPYFDTNTPDPYLESPVRIGDDIYFTAKSGLFKVDVSQKLINQLYRDEILMPAGFVEEIPGGNILTGWSTSKDPIWGDSKSGVILETSTTTNISKIYPFTIPDVPNIKVDRTFAGIGVSRNSKFIWVYTFFDPTNIPKEDSNFNERIELMHFGRMPMINRTSGEVNFVPYNELSQIPIEDLPNWQGWPGYKNQDGLRQ
jgi:hypothetical protein